MWDLITSRAFLIGVPVGFVAGTIAGFLFAVILSMGRMVDDDRERLPLDDRAKKRMKAGVDVG